MTDVGPTDVNPPAHEFIDTIPPDADAAERTRLQQLYGFFSEVNSDFDAFAVTIAEKTGAMATGVNWIGPDLNQLFVGMAFGDGTEVLPEHRLMPGDHGFCTTMVTRRKNKALGLQDLLADPRYALNPVVEEHSEANPGGLNLRAYLGTPLLPPEGIAIGSLFAVDNKKREDWKMSTVQWLKDFARYEVMPYILRRAQRRELDQG